MFGDLAYLLHFPVFLQFASFVKITLNRRMILLITTHYLLYKSISNQKIHYWSSSESNPSQSVTEDGRHCCRNWASYRHFSFTHVFTGIMVEIIGLRVYSMNDTKLLLVQGHCDCSKTAFRSQKMCYLEQSELKNRRAFPSQMAVFLLLEVTYPKPSSNAQVLCGMRCRF